MSLFRPTKPLLRVNEGTTTSQCLLLVMLLLSVQWELGTSLTPTTIKLHPSRSTSSAVVGVVRRRSGSTIRRGRPNASSPMIATHATTAATSTTTTLSATKNTEPPTTILPGIGPEGCQLPSPSKINTLDQPIQAAIFVSIFVVLGIGTYGLSSVLENWTLQYEWFQTWRYTWPVLGLIYAAAGVTHFTVAEEYENTYPPNGTWGIWYLPGTSTFHVQWTGIAELLGGIGLVAGGVIDAFAPVYLDSPNLLSTAGLLSDSAAALFLLTIAVTPANIYMYTHGAKLPREGPDVPVVGHLIRGIFQIILLSLLYEMGQGTFDAWSNSI